MRALAIAATGMNAQQTQCRGHREQHREYQHHVVQAFARGIHRSVLPDRSHAGRPEPRGDAAIPEGANLGLGVRSAAVRKLHMQGALTQTGNPSTSRSTAAAGSRSRDPNGETLYTRAGSFNTNADRPARDGRRLSARSDDHRSAGNGGGHRQPDRARCYAKLDNEVAPRQIGQLTLANFRQRGGPRAARQQSLSRDHGVRRRRSSASPAIPATARSTSAIWRARTSIRSRKSPS